MAKRKLDASTDSIVIFKIEILEYEFQSTFGIVITFKRLGLHYFENSITIITDT